MIYKTNIGYVFFYKRKKIIIGKNIKFDKKIIIYKKTINNSLIYSKKYESIKTYDKIIKKNEIQYLIKKIWKKTEIYFNNNYRVLFLWESVMKDEEFEINTSNLKIKQKYNKFIYIEIEYVKKDIFLLYIYLEELIYLWEYKDYEIYINSKKIYFKKYRFNSDFLEKAYKSNRIQIKSKYNSGELLKMKIVKKK